MVAYYDVMMSLPGGLPLYAKVESVLSSEIANGTLAVGGQIPSEDSLIERFDVSRITVRRAIQNLVARGLVEIRRGKGTFVSAPRIVQELTELSGFVEDMHAIGRKPTAIVLSQETVVANAVVARHLALTKGQRVTRIRRVRLADDVPISFDETFLPLEIGKKVVAHDLRVEPIFSLLERKYSIPLIEAEYRMEAATATADVALALRVKEGNPVLIIERTSYSSRNAPVDYERLHYRGDLVSFVTRLMRKRDPSP